MQSPGLLFKKKRHVILLTLIVLLYLINGVVSLRANSITSDEASFMDYAIRFMRGHPERVYPRTDNSKMPVSVINMLPRVIEQVSGSALKKDDGGESDTMHGRYVTLAVSVFIILLVYRWSKELYGNNAGLFAAFLASVCPNTISNAILVTTDSYSTLFLLASMYYCWKYCSTKQQRYFIFLTLVVAFAQLVKQSLFHLYILIPFAITCYTMLQRPTWKWQLAVKQTLFFILINFVVINSCYYFNGSFTTLGNYQFMSQLFQGVQQVFPPGLPLPFPKPFVDGLDMAKYYDQIGGGIDKVSSFGKVHILNRSSTGGGFWYYYFISFFYKTPIAYFIFGIWSVVLVWKRRQNRSFARQELFLLLPVLYFLVIMSFFYKTQCGIRHIVFLYPFLFVFAGSILQSIRTNTAKIGVIMTSLFLLISVGRYWSNYWPYTNEFISDKKMAYRVVGPGNLEFHQGYLFAAKYLTQHPEVQWAPKQPAEGLFLINTADYLDIWNRHEYDWLHHFLPVDHVAYNFLLIDTRKQP